MEPRVQDTSIVEARAIDVDALFDLISQPDMSPDTRLSHDERLALFQSITHDTAQHIFVARRAEEIVGTLSLLVIHRLSHNGTKHLLVEDVVVRRDQQSKGIGKQLMAFAIAKATEWGCGSVVLSTGTQRKAAHEFYERLGFIRQGFTFYLALDNRGIA